MSSANQLTTTSYAILGLLALRDWSTYELAQQMQRSMRLWWPRAESRVYAEPKRLVRLGLAEARDEGVGARPRPVYSITPAGRRSLRSWIGEPSDVLRLEFEAMLKVFFADQGTKAQALANIERVRQVAEADLAHDAAFVEEYLTTGGPFPERLHIIGLATDLYARLLEATLAWADDAAAEVASWPSTRRAPEPRRRLLARRRPAPPS